MALTVDQKMRIGEEVKKILLRRIQTFPAENTKVRNAPFHEAFLAYFEDKIRPLKIELPYLVAIASWLHGLNTSLGSGFESFAHILSGGFKRSFTQDFTLKIKQSQAEAIETIIRNLKSGRTIPNLLEEEKKISEILSWLSL